jgi:hypothetical protein
MAFGNGSQNRPFDFGTALSWDSYGAFPVVKMMAGTYSGAFTNSLAEVVTFQPDTTTPKIDGELIVNGSDVIFKGLEIYYTGWTDRENTDENSADDIATLGDLNVRAPRVKFINCIIHDLKLPYIGQEAVGAEFYGCVLYHNGWLAPLRGHGHGLYLQNSEATQMKVRDCIIHDCFGWGLHAYAGNGATLLKNIVMEGNTCLRSGSLSGTARPDILLGGDSGQSTGCSIKSNMTYGGSVGVSFYEAGAALQDFTNNYCPNDKNQAWGGYTAVNESGNYWGSAIGNEVFLRANDYDSNRANLTIYNQAAANTVNVDVSSVFGASGTVKAYNVQDYFTDIQTLTISSGSITVNMQAVNRTVATPDSWDAPATTFPAFGCFVLIKQ